MSSSSYEDFLREEQRFFRMFEEKVGIPMARAMFDAIDKAWGDAIQKAKTNHDAVPEATADSTHERPPNVRCQQTCESRCAASGSGSGTGNTQEPVAWAVMPANSDYCVAISTRREAAQKAAERKVEVGEYATMDDIVVVPLYRHPSPTLTDAEREAVETAAYVAEWFDSPNAATLRGLLERLA